MCRWRFSLLLVATLLTASIFFVGEILTDPAATTVGAPPIDLRAEAVAFPTVSGGAVKGWVTHGTPGKGALLLLHGVRSDRRQMVARARFLGKTGYSVMLIDLPAHGESTGSRITFGWTEAEAVRAALAQLAEIFPGEKIGVIGVSLGAAAMVLAKPARVPQAVVLESMYPTITEAVNNRLAQRLGPSGKVLAPLLLWQLPLRLGISSEQLSPITELPTLSAPVLIVAGTDDEHTTVAETRRLFAAAKAPKDLWLVGGAKHVDLHAYAGRVYEERIRSFLRTHMGNGN